ncbi:MULTISPECIES: hypothetical protein [unclassified Crossiella]|uniref:hypothetical protein n=1 Tax=unclassified Crossiella TaxID=2620835 RepID=UPI001FFF83E0|nr:MULTISPECIES: hypothetical protein [unclassified Crossiella]MCK2240941.1 hypothetical protein [Crossiella sp. S99.2]MCK2253915.1 hypothetical protein [Crossiella sp. S99.1]
MSVLAKIAATSAEIPCRDGRGRRRAAAVGVTPYNDIALLLPGSDSVVLPVPAAVLLREVLRDIAQRALCGPTGVSVDLRYADRTGSIRHLTVQAERLQVALIAPTTSRPDDTVLVLEPLCVGRLRRALRSGIAQARRQQLDATAVSA